MYVPDAVNIKAVWDEEAGVYVATSEDIPGLATEAETLDGLLVKLKVVIPELFALNGYTSAKPTPPMNLLTSVSMQAC